MDDPGWDAVERAPVAPSRTRAQLYEQAKALRQEAKTYRLLAKASDWQALALEMEADRMAKKGSTNEKSSREANDS